MLQPVQSYFFTLGKSSTIWQQWRSGSLIEDCLKHRESAQWLFNWVHHDKAMHGGSDASRISAERPITAEPTMLMLYSVYAFQLLRLRLQLQL